MSEESLLSDAPVEETTTEETTGTTEASTEAPEGWFLADEIQGQGDTPEWFKNNKYKTVADQAKAYAGLESKLGSFTGAPEDGYKIEMPEGVEGSFAEDDPLLVQFNEWASEAGLSQEAHSQLLGVYVNNMVESQPNMADEIKKIGKDAQQRLNDIGDWARNNFNESEYGSIQQIATTADGFMVLEKMRSMMRETQVSAPDHAKPVSSISEEKLYEMVADPRYESSPSFRAEVESKFRDYFGSQPASEVRQ